MGGEASGGEASGGGASGGGASGGEASGGEASGGEASGGGASGQGDDLGVLLRWEAGGGTWRVSFRGPGRVGLDLTTCTGDEVMARLTSSDPRVLDHVGQRECSDEV